jgi:hypothetical protein
MALAIYTVGAALLAVGLDVLLLLADRRSLR